MIFRSANEQDFDQLLTLMTGASLRDPLNMKIFRQHFGQSGRLFNFIARVQRVRLHQMLNKQYVVVGVVNNQVIAAAVLAPNRWMPVSFGQYLQAGAFSLFPECWTLPLLKSVQQYQLVQKVLHKRMSRHTWVLQKLVVNPMYEEARLGQQMLEDGIFPELRRLHVDCLLSTTTMPEQQHFFAKNHFELVEVLKLHVGQLGVENWCFQRSLS